MIDLDSFESLLENYQESSALYIELGILLARGRIDYVSFQRIAKWLNCYEYVLPYKRDLLVDLSDYLYFSRPYNLFALALVASHLAAHFSQEQQFILLARLAEGSDRRMEKSPQTCGTLTTDVANFDLLTDETNYAD